MNEPTVIFTPVCTIFREYNAAAAIAEANAEDDTEASYSLIEVKGGWAIEVTLIETNERICLL